MITLPALAISAAAIVLTITVGIPAAIDLVRDYRVSSRAGELLADIALAQTEAIRRQARTALCKSVYGVCNVVDPWILDERFGWLVFVDADADGLLDDNETLLRATDTSALSVSQLPGERVIFEGNGRPAAPTAVNICDSRGPSYARRIEIDSTGAVSVCSGSDSMLGESCSGTLPICGD